MPYKDPDHRRDYARRYAKRHPQILHESPGARERRLQRMKEYRQTPNGREAARRGSARHAQTAKGKASQRRATKKYLRSPLAPLRWQRYNARKIANGGNVTSGEWNTVLDMYTDHRGTMCAYCYQIIEKPTMDHVEPISASGQHSVDNIVTACKSCNSSKGPKPLLRWMYDKFAAVN